ncbi:MAG: hypothetical protein DCC68_17530 [Planctomycetota bacterium]|nr:MAG: hypothetical protein DCC68_17530 [Planctomycetota bacterium]
MAMTRRASVWMAIVLVATAATSVRSQVTADVRPNWSKASWVWSHEKALVENHDACSFRRKFTLSSKPVEGAIAVTADNGYELYVNGRFVANDGPVAGEVWRSVELFRIGEYLHEGPNVIAVRARNLGGPGGLAAAVKISLGDGSEVTFETDGAWLTLDNTASGWTQADHDDSLWGKAVRLGNLGMMPWGRLDLPNDYSLAGRRHPHGGKFTAAPADFSWPTGVVFVAGQAPLNSTPGGLQAKWEIGGSRAFFEHDTPTPGAVGRRLCALAPARPGEKPRVLVDAGDGILGSPAVSFDGKEIVFAMAPAGEQYFKLFRISAEGVGLTRLTQGPWHDYDPEYLPDGRIVFASTRMGSRDEYHGNAARCLCTLSVDRKLIEALTQHIVGDSEPRVMADGRIAFVRSDNFLERAKVETHIHAVRADGTGGEVLLGPDRGAIGYDPSVAAEDDALWLRTFGFGCPTPLPDGRVACLSHAGPIVSARAGFDPGHNARHAKFTALLSDVPIFDMSALADGRLLCTTLGQSTLAVLDPASGNAVVLFEADGYDVHSVVYLGTRPKPPAISQRARVPEPSEGDATGLLVCQNVFASKQTAADWQRVKAVRVFAGQPLTLRAARHPYGHVGVEAIEIGAAPLASDGSFHLRVPADRALALQAVDAEGRAVVNELSWIYVRPGEQRSCTGCHERHERAPPSGPALATRFPPVELSLGTAAHRFRGNNAANGGVLNLQLDRFREVASINLYPQDFADGGGELASGRAVQISRLTHLLREGNTSERGHAATRLAVLRDRAAEMGLVAALADEAVQVRVQAALALAACGGRRSLGSLAAAVGDRDANVSQAALVALEHITGHRESCDPYSNPGAREGARRSWEAWLAAANWTDIERELLARGASNDPSEAQRAVEAIARIGGDASAEWLRKAIARGDWPSLRCELAAFRALGQVGNDAAVPVLEDALKRNLAVTNVPTAKSHEFGWAQAPVHRAGAAAEALGRIGSSAAEDALLGSFAAAAPAWQYAYQTGDHDWLMGCHASVPHFRLVEALDAISSRRAASLAATILRAVPIDTDRGLLFENDAYEALTARVLERSGIRPDIVDACLAVLGEPLVRSTPQLIEAVSASPPAVSVGPLDAPSRAAQILSIVRLDEAQAQRVSATFERYRTGDASRTKSWVCFYLARALGKARCVGAVPKLMATLAEQPTDATFGTPLPPNVFLFESMTPRYRAAAADALGRMSASEAAPVLWATLHDFQNAMDVRHAAARALARTANETMLDDIRASAQTYPEFVTRRTLADTYRTLRAAGSAPRDSAGKGGAQSGDEKVRD